MNYSTPFEEGYSYAAGRLECPCEAWKFAVCRECPYQAPSLARSRWIEGACAYRDDVLAAARARA